MRSGGRRPKTLVDKSGEAEADLAPVAVAVSPGLRGEVSDLDRRLGEALVERGLLTPTQLTEATLQMASPGQRLGPLLVELGAVDERTLAEVLSDQLQVPLVDLRREVPEPDAVRLLPQTIARALTAIPVRVVDDLLVVAVADPSDGDVAAQLTQAVGRPVQLAVAAPHDIAMAIDRSYRALGGVASLVEAFETTESLRRIAEGATRVTTDDAPVVQVVNLIVTQGLRDRASDVHIEPQAGRVRVRYRIDGALHDVLALPESIGPSLVSRIKIMASMNIVERRKPQDGQMGMEVDGRPIDIRISTAPTIWGEKAVLRLLDRNRVIFRLEDLGMPPDIHDRFSKMVRSPYGMVICGGPTGSGKTTTLYSTLTEINQTERNITTIEDPVEYVFSSINQMQINDQAGISFANGLRSILRQDPDVILIGEIRDAETARISVESALTGHFVLSSIHATDAASGLQRFVEMGIESFLLASTTVGVVSQRLVRRICTNCRVPFTPPVEELAFFRQVGGARVAAKTTYFQGEGCNFCSRTGYLERVGVFELLTVSDAVKKVLVAGGTVDQLRAVAVGEGMRTLLDEGARLVAEDVTTIAEIMRGIYVL